jgi:hypothetical protein
VSPRHSRASTGRPLAGRFRLAADLPVGVCLDRDVEDVDRDISSKLAHALPRYMIFVIVLTMLLLLIVFRSVAIPVKAALAILLSIGASLGIVVARARHQ